MVTFQYHKGQPCQYKPTLCQEGYCKDCQIYADHLNGNKQLADLKAMREASRLYEGKGTDNECVLFDNGTDSFKAISTPDYLTIIESHDTYAGKTVKTMRLDRATALKLALFLLEKYQRQEVSPW